MAKRRKKIPKHGRCVLILDAKKHMTETEVQRECIKIFRKAGWLVLRERQQHVEGRNFQGTPGVSDIICCMPPIGKWVAIEFKANKEKYDEWVRQDNPNVKSHKRAIQQKEFGRKVRACGGYFKCIYSTEQARQLVKDLS